MEQLLFKIHHAQTDISQSASEGLGRVVSMSDAMLLMHGVLDMLLPFVIVIRKGVKSLRVFVLSIHCAFRPLGLTELAHQATT
jgi:hypothetical protein